MFIFESVSVSMPLSRATVRQCLAGIVLLTSPVFGQSQQAEKQQNISSLIADSLPAHALGPNDLIAISVYDAPEFTKTVRVAEDGTITFPFMRAPVQVAGLMPREVESRVATALQTEHLLKEPMVTVVLSAYGTRPIIVTGAVRNSVTFQVVGKVTLLDALTRAGGVSSEAGPDILVNDSQGSESGLVRRISIKKLLEGADPMLNLTLRAGDEVRIPVASRIYVSGNVKNTGSFPIVEAADTTVLGALALAGGFAGPKPNEAYIIRRDDTSAGTHRITVPLSDIIEHKAPDISLLAHDYLYIPNNRRRETLLMLEKLAAVAGSGAFVINVAK